MGKRGFDIFTWPSRKTYKRKGWAKRKIKELEGENEFYKKYGKGNFGPNRWNTNIKLQETDKLKPFIVKWENNMKIPKIPELLKPKTARRA